MLEEAGLIELVEERPRRGFVERVMRVTANAFLVDPGVLTSPDEADEADEASKADETGGGDGDGGGATGTAEGFRRVADQYAAEHLVEVAADTVRDVTRMAATADRQGVRLLTFTLEARVRFAEPGDVHDFTDALADALSQVAARFDTPVGGSTVSSPVGIRPPVREEPVSPPARRKPMGIRSPAREKTLGIRSPVRRKPAVDILPGTEVRGSHVGGIP